MRVGGHGHNGSVALLLLVALVYWELTGTAVGQIRDSDCGNGAEDCRPDCTRCGNGTVASDRAMREKRNETEEAEKPFFTDAPNDRKSSEGSLAVALIFIALFNFGFCCCCWCCCRALDSISDPRNVTSGVNPLRGITLRGLLAPQDLRQAAATTASTAAPILRTSSTDRASAAGDDSGGSPTRKPSVSVVVVQPGGGVEIGVRSESV